MKIVIVANTIFPHNQPRAFRSTELAKQFAKIGHEVHLYGVLGEYDYQKFEKQYNINVHNIGKMRFYPIKSDRDHTSYTFWQKVFGKVGGKIIAYPEIEFVPKMRALLQHQNSIDLLISLAPSHAIHWGIALAKSQIKDFPKVWIADNGDPFVGRNTHPAYFKYIEDFTFNKVTWVTIPISNAFEAYNPDIHHKIRIIPQGFDFEEVVLPETSPKNNIPTFIYAGAFYKDIRDPIHFLSYLNQVDKPFRFRVFTRTNETIRKYKEIFGDLLEINPIIPRHDLLVEMNKADFLVNFSNNNTIQSPSKLIDYWIAKRPILNIEPDKIDHKIIDEFLNGIYDHRFILQNPDQYRIENVANKFIELYKKSIQI